MESYKQWKNRKIVEDVGMAQQPPTTAAPITSQPQSGQLVMPPAYTQFMAQLQTKPPAQLMQIQRQFNQDIQRILQQKSSSAVQKDIRGMMQQARTGLQNFGQQAAPTV